MIFGEPDIEIIPFQDNGANADQIQVKINGVDVFHPNTGEIRSDGPEGIACWFIDTDYNEESFFVRHAYFLGANDPYKALKTTLKAEIERDAWQTLHSDTSRPFDRPTSGRIAVKVINHLGDEVMKVLPRMSQSTSRYGTTQSKTTRLLRGTTFADERPHALTSPTHQRVHRNRCRSIHQIRMPLYPSRTSGTRAIRHR